MAKEPSPSAELARLESSLAAGLCPGYVLRGAEPWHLGQAERALRAAARAAGLELCQHDTRGGSFSKAALLDDLCGSALFAAARCVVVAGAAELLKKSGGQDSPVTRAVRSFLEGTRGTVVLVGDGLRADAAAVKAVKKAGGDVYGFRPLWDSPPPWDPDPSKTELVQWLLARGNKVGVRLSPEAAVLLVKAKGSDLGALESELERIARVGPEAVRELIGDSVGSPMRLADLLADGDAPQALFEIERLWRGGFQKSGSGGGRETSAGAILAVLFGSLRRGVRQGLVGSSAVAHGLDIKLAADEAGVPTWPKARQAFQARVASRTPREWRSMYTDLADLERRSRSGAEVDANDLCAFALRWRRRTQTGAGARR